MGLSYNKIAPEGTFIADYMQAQSHTETALAYDFWAAMWLLSLACGRAIYVDRPHAPVYLNLYCLFIADSGVTRKSSAIRNALAIGQHLIEDRGIGLIEARTTASALDRYLHYRTEETGSAQCALVISEFSSFMQQGVSMPVLLTDLYDCPSHRTGAGTIALGKIVQHDVWLSFLSASTPEWLLRVVSPTVMEGGFTSRCMFILADQPKARIAWPSVHRANTDLVTPLLGIRDAAQRYGTITLNEAAMRTFVGWYERRKFHTDVFNASFETREDAHVLRIAALLCANDGTWVVQAAHIQNAIRIIAEVKANAQSLFASAGARSKWFLGVEAVRDVLLVHIAEPVARSKIYLRCRQYVDQAEFSAILDTMHESGVVKRFLSYNDGPGRPVEYIQATELIRAKDVITRVADSH